MRAEIAYKRFLGIVCQVHVLLVQIVYKQTGEF